MRPRRLVHRLVVVLVTVGALASCTADADPVNESASRPAAQAPEPTAVPVGPAPTSVPVGPAPTSVPVGPAPTSLPTPPGCVDSDRFDDGIDVIVFMNPDVSPGELEATVTDLDAWPLIARYTYVDQREAFAEFQEMFAGSNQTRDSVTAEDMPPSFRIVISEPGEQSETEVVERYRDDDGVFSVIPKSDGCEARARECAAIEDPRKEGIAFITPDASQADLDRMRQIIMSDPSVDTVEFTNQAQAFQELFDQHKDEPSILSGLDENDAPSSFAFTAHRDADLSDLIERLRNDALVFSAFETSRC